MSKKLFAAATSNSNSSDYVSRSGVITFLAYGTWDGATLQVQLSPDEGTTWISAGSDLAFTADGVGNLQCAVGVRYRANLSGVGASTSVSMTSFDG